MVQTLVELILKSDKSQAEIARKCLISETKFNKFVNGEKTINSDEVDRLCKFFKLELK